MSFVKTPNNNAITHCISFNWPIVGFLLFMLAIPGIPAIFIVLSVTFNEPLIEMASSIVNVAYFNSPSPIMVHGISGIIFFMTIPFQFSKAIRINHAIWHRVSGIFAVASGGVMAVSGIWMHLAFAPNTFDTRLVSILTIAIALCVAFTLAILFIRKRNIPMHRKWMIRAVAIALGAVSPLFIEAAAVVFAGNNQALLNTFAQLLHDAGLILGMILNLLIVECMFLKQQNKMAHC
ncbi:DUF2306 domain-containing protein [Thalassotalea fusca]